jgi:hypothetical protein
MKKIYIVLMLFLAPVSLLSAMESQDCTDNSCQHVSREEFSEHVMFNWDDHVMQVNFKNSMKEVFGQVLKGCCSASDEMCNMVCCEVEKVARRHNFDFYDYVYACGLFSRYVVREYERLRNIIKDGHTFIYLWIVIANVTYSIRNDECLFFNEYAKHKIFIGTAEAFRQNKLRILDTLNWQLPFKLEHLENFVVRVISKNILGQMVAKGSSSASPVAITE